MRRISGSLLFSIYVLASVCRAFLANRWGSNRWLPLPPVASKPKASPSMEQLVARVDRTVAPVTRNTAHPCLYYSYARCRVLRRWGYPVQLNIGLHNLHGSMKAEGHCWVSSEGRALFEDKDPHEMYPDKMGERGDVVYWARLKGEKGKRFVRFSNE